jgi:hypothetical protein
MRQRLQFLFWLPPDWLEGGLAAYAVVISAFMLAASRTYYTSPVWAPVAGWLPHWALAAYIAGAGLVWGGAVLYQRLPWRLAACLAGIGFWLFIALLISRQAPGAVGAGLWWGHAVLHGLVWVRLLVAWVGRAPARGPDHGYADD